ncbi:MAG: hypothetical protein EA369_10205 [Bradymonadales bacterium]|nr:MAG: hypothetical protein EA369_10205 [Bradymonadales bacterium]
MKRRIAALILVLSSAGLLSACKPGPVDPPFQRQMMTGPVDISKLKMDEEHLYHRLGVTALWSKTGGLDPQGNPVVVAVIGSGVDYTNPDIRDSLWINSGEVGERAWASGWDNDGNGYADDVIGYDFYDGDPWPYDWHGHDTYTASLIASSGQSGSGVVGVAPQAKLMVLRTIGGDGRGNAFDAYLAIRYAVDNGARIIYLNWPQGGYGPLANLVHQGLEYAKTKNVLVVLPAGNDRNQGVGPLIDRPDLVQMENVIVVAGATEDGRLTDSTNYGLERVSLAAPATESLGYFPRGEVAREALSTSSVAAAYVTGAAALIASLPGYGRADQIRDALLKKGERDPNLPVLSQSRLNLHSLAKQ